MIALKKIINIWLFAGVVFLLPFCSKKASGGAPIVPPVITPPSIEKTFVNPLINGADPWVIRKDGFYYYLQTLGNRIAIWKTAAISKLGIAPNTEVFRAVAGTPNSANIWAPELHFLNNKWYVYYTAGAGPDSTQRTWVLENTNADPTLGAWTDKGKIFASDANGWSIDGTVLSYAGNNYFLWSGRPNLAVQNQNIYIAKMSNPWTLQTPTVMLTKPEFAWEVNGGAVNEGPEILLNKAGKAFLIYSASGCWTDDYALGILSLKEGTDPMVTANWIKNPQPVFTKLPSSNAYGPGHNAFFISPDATQYWILYHANSNSGDGCADKRNVRMQPFTWNTDGSPNFGVPVKINTPIPVPAGE